MGHYGKEKDANGRELGECWVPDPGSPFRGLTAQEVADLRYMAETTTPLFVDVKEVRKDFRGNEYHHEESNASWESHHPVAREVWERRGLKPKE